MPRQKAGQLKLVVPALIAMSCGGAQSTASQQISLPTPSAELAVQTAIVPSASNPLPPVGAPPPTRVAITFDDLPAHGPLLHDETRMQIIEKFLAAFRSHRLPPVTGFINGGKLEGHERERNVLEAWVHAGNPLGNHTYSHSHLSDIGVSAYIADIDRNDPILESLTAQANVGSYKTFRYPFLEEGTDIATREAIRNHLSAHGYRIAAVTIDFGDWAWNEPYARCAETHDDRAIRALKTTYIGNADHFLAWAKAAGAQIYGRSIPQILLLHIGAFDAEMIDALLSSYEDMGVKFIALDEALADPIYTTDTRDLPDVGSTFLEQLINTENLPHPPFLTQIIPLLDAMCR